MHNFCLDKEGNYVVADVPGVVLGDDSVTPLCRVGDDVICYRGCELLSVDVKGCDETVIGELPGVPRCAAVSGGVVVVMCDGGARKVIRGSGGKFVLLPEVKSLPFRFVTSAGGVDSVDVGQPLLTKLGTACVDAYCEVVRRAAGVGRLTAPVMVRYKLYDGRGNEVYRSVPVVVGERNNTEYTFKTSEDEKGNRIAQVGQMSFGTYKLRVEPGMLPETIWREYIAEMRVEATVPFHAVASGDSALIYSRDNTEVTVHLAGESRALNADIMEAALARFDDISSVVATVHNPFKHENGVDISFFASGNAVSVADGLALSLSKPINSSESMGYASFVARRCAVSAGAILWGGVKGVYATAPSPFVMAKAIGSRRWHADVRVRVADGDCVIDSFEGEGEPLALSPLIAWPQPNAESMTMVMNVDGDDELRTLTVPLHNDPSGRYSIYAEPNGRDIAFSLGDDEIDKGEALTTTQYDDTAMIVTALDAPLCARQLVSVGSRVHALTAAYSSGGAWDFGRARFYAFTDTGIYIVAVERKLAVVSMAILCSDRVSNVTCVTESDKAICYLTDGGLLKRLSGTQSTLIDDAVPGDAVAFSTALNAVYVLNSDDNQCRVYPLHRAKEYARVNGGNAYYTQDCIARRRDTSLPIGLFVTDKGVVDFANPQRPAASVEGCVVSLPVKRVEVFDVNLLTSKVSGEILLTRHYVTRGRCVTMAEVSLNGCFTSPIRLPLTVLAPLATWVVLRGTFSPDSRIQQ